MNGSQDIKPIKPPHQLLSAVLQTDGIVVQNCLLTTGDVDLAILLSDVPEEQVPEILKEAGTKKSARVIQELERLRRVKVQEKDLLAFQERFISRLQGNKTEAFRRYFRPKDRSI